VKISEIFGPTFQGEGPSTGRRAGFVRFGRCDLACSWCDTPYTWDWTGQNGTAYDPAVELAEMDVDQVCEAIAIMGVDMVVITGGEPFVQAGALTELATALAFNGYAIEVETNGRHAPAPALTEAVSAFNVSPKLPNSRQSLTLTWRSQVLKAFVATNKARFKFVCQDAADVGLVAHLAAGEDIAPADIWVMPEGRTAKEVQGHLLDVAEAALAYGFNLTGRMHVDIWAGARAR
jgi:7-carboxy-7-deazaguanine synthase